MAIATLAVNLIARTSAFEKGMGRSRKKLSFVQRQAMATRAAILSMAKGMLFAAGVGGMGILIKRSFDTIDATAKMSDRLGIATEDIIAFGHAAKITGMDTAGMNKALETFVRRIGEVRLGTGQAKVALEKLGLSADDLANQKLADNFQVIAERISKMENASDKAATAYFLFGRQGQQMLNFLNMGARGLDVFRAEVDRLGLSFSRLDAAKVEAANDAMVRLKARFTGLAQTAAIQLAPAIEAVATKLTEMGASGVNAQASMIKGFEALTVRAAHLADFIKRTGAAFQFAGAAVLGFFAPVGLLGKGGRDNIKAISMIAREMRDEAAAILATPFDPTAINKWFDDVEMRAVEATRNIAKSAITAVPAIAAEADDQAQAWVTAGKALTKEVMTPMEKYEEKISNINDLIKKGVINWETYGRAVRKFRKELGGAAVPDIGKSGSLRATFPQTSDFGVLPGPEVSVKGLAIGGIDNNLLTESKKQTGYLAIIAGKEGLG